MTDQRSDHEEVIHQLRKVNSQLNPGPAFLKFAFWTVLVIFGVFGSFGLMMQLAHYFGTNTH
jgi:hypothetical protein